MLTADLTDRQFTRIAEIVYAQCGINLKEGKEELVKSRLMKRLRQLELPSFDAYIRHLEGDVSGNEMVTMIDCLTTNKTSFFREPQHFDFLKRVVLPACGSKVRIWSAGCSTGEEPYTLAIVLREFWPDIDVRDGRARDVRILATDISTRVLERAKEGVYTQDVLADVSAQLLPKYFECVEMKKPRLYQVRSELSSLITFARLNLMEDWPMSGPFDAIFCRNVMIYFDKPTQETLINRYAGLLRSGGHLFVGHSESLAGLRHPLKYVQPALYRKE